MSTQTCSNCSNVCFETANYYMTVPNHDHDLLKQLLVCAKVCQLCAESCALGTPNSDDIMQLCAKVCNDCATSCGDYPDNDTLAHCCQVCTDCNEACSAPG